MVFDNLETSFELSFVTRKNVYDESLINGLLSFLIIVMNRACHDVRIVTKWTDQTYSSLSRALARTITFHHFMIPPPTCRINHLRSMITDVLTSGARVIAFT